MGYSIHSTKECCYTKSLPFNLIDDLRNISGLKHFNKVIKHFFAEVRLSDMKENLDISQYRNQKGVSIQNYLVKFVDQKKIFTTILKATYWLLYQPLFSGNKSLIGKILS